MHKRYNRIYKRYTTIKAKMADQVTETRLVYAIIALMTLVSFTFTANFEQLHSDYIVNKAGSQVVRVVGPDKLFSGGTGFAVRGASGKVYTLTNGHVCQLAKNGQMIAILPGLNQAYALKLLALSDETDLCLLTGIPGYGGVSLAGSAAIGENVSVVGHPLLLPLTYVKGRLTAAQTITLVYQQNGKEEDCIGPGFFFKDLSGTLAEFFGLKNVCLRSLKSVLTTLGIYPGNSGSPAVNKYGNLIGVVFAGNTTTNYGYVIPLEQVREFLKDY